MKPARVLIFIVAYNAESTLKSVLHRLPLEKLKRFQLDVLIIDDSSPDHTFEVGLEEERSGLPVPLKVMRTPVNQGYGGNQKLGYRYAIEHGYDYVVLLHGDGQYAPEVMPELLAPFAAGDADAVFGSRMMRKAQARRGGMPLYKWVGNKILTFYQNKVLRAGLTEFHSGYRIYSIKALQAIPFERNSNDFVFDTQIIIQLLNAHQRIREVPIPTYYGDEICHVDGMKYALQVFLATARSRLHKAGVLYDRTYDVEDPEETPYQPKLEYVSSHTMAIRAVEPGSEVLDVGGGEGFVAGRLARQKDCRVTILDEISEHQGQRRLEKNCRFIRNNLDTGKLPVELTGYDTILLLDVIEHLRDPETFLEDLRAAAGRHRPRIVITVPNVAFFVVRFMLLLGQFNYGRRGILDRTHTRLFTFGSLRKMLGECGYMIREIRGVPAPFPLALGDNLLSRFLVLLNQWGIRLWPGLFSYQIFVQAQPLPTVQALLEQTLEESDAARRSFRRQKAVAADN